MTNPDVSWTSANMSINSTRTITVTQKPKYIQMLFINLNVSSGFSGIFDVKNNKTFRSGYYYSTIHNEAWSNYTDYITSVSASSVTVKNGYGNNCAVVVNIYY